MKKKLTMILASLFLVLGTAWAQFAPTEGKMYALKENTSGLYLDIQTLGINEPNANATTNNISLNANPRAVYFEAGNDGKWKLKNGRGEYVQQASSREWNVVIGEQAYEWTISEPSTGLFTIARADGNFVSMDNVSAGQPLYCDKASGLQFVLEEYTGIDITGKGSQATINVVDVNGHAWTSVPAGTAWTISMDVENPNGASFNQWGSSIFAIGGAAFPEKNNYRGLQFYLQSSTNGGKLDAVFDGGDHLIDNVTHTGNFSASISYNGNNQLQIKTTNASSTVSINDYTLNKALAEFSQLSYGLPTGINVKNLLIAPLSHSVDYPTAATVSNGKYTFTSNKILYGGQCNKIRFTLTESGAYYQNGAKRMSLDLFELFDAQGNKVELKETYFTGNYNKSYAGLLDGVNAGAEGAGCCCGAWNSAAEGDDYFEIALPDGVDLGGAFSFSFVTENTTMNAKAFRIDFWYEQREEVKYTFAINAPEGKEFTVTYNNEDIAVGTELDNDFDTELFAATEIPGYTWSIVVDEESHAVTLVYKAVEIVNNPDAVMALVNRIGGTGTADKFKFVLDPSLNSKQEVFVLGSEDGKILVKGTTISAITTGLGWYLNHIAHINIAWNSLNEKTVSGAAYADLSNLPLPSQTETHTSDAKYRYYLNTCTFGYSMTLDMEALAAGD